LSSFVLRAGKLPWIIEIRPHRWGWKVFEAPGVEPVFPEKDQAINYAQNRAIFRSGEIRFKRQSNAPFRSTKRIETIDARRAGEPSTASRG